MPVNIPPEKFCKGCNLTKKAREFSFIKGRYKDRIYHCLQSKCKSCMVAHSKAYRKIHPVVKKRISTRTYVPRGEMNSMKSPLNWHEMKGDSLRWAQHKEYPVCQLGHKYVGDTCLPCKFKLNVGYTVGKRQTIEL